jgi:sugar phosphate isomerase/epimerase
MGLLDSEELVASYFTLSGAPVLAPSRYPFIDRVTAAADAGLVGMGMLREDYEHLIATGHTGVELRSIANDHGVAIPEVEFLTDWFLGESDPAGPGEHEATLYEMAGVFGAQRLNAGMMLPPGELPPFDDVVERFAALCRRAAEHGITVALEPMPFGCLETPTRAADIVRAAGSANAGVLLDSYHFFRGPADLDALRAIAPEAIVSIQLSDATSVPSRPLAEESVTDRRVPNDGFLDIPTLLVTIAEMGVEAPLAVEVMSDELRRGSVKEAAQRVAIGGLAVIRAARDRLAAAGI